MADLRNRFSPLRRVIGMAKAITGRIVGPEPKQETGHFYTCPTCSQMVDMRRLGEVLHHEVPCHHPIRSN